MDWEDLEALYWRFDAMHRGYGAWEGRPTSERDAFKRTVKQALAEKDLQWKRRVGLDCGGHSCFYAIDKTGMRHNGPCSCNPKRTKEDYDRLYQAYKQLMEKAVGWASYIMTIDDRSWESYKEAELFLASPEVQAWKEQQS